jgi:ribosomal protein S18 acetylase RimI-like enzyme
MALRLRPMADREFDEWVTSARQEYVRQRVEAGEPEDVAQRLSDEQHEQMFPGGRPGPGHRLFCVDRGGEQIGVVWVGPYPQRPDQNDSVWLYDIEIAAPYRGQGAGRQALTLLEEQLRADGHTELGLNVFGHNLVARELYTSAGYREVAVTMVKPLSG